MLMPAGRICESPARLPRPCSASLGCQVITAPAAWPNAHDDGRRSCFSPPWWARRGRRAPGNL